MNWHMVKDKGWMFSGHCQTELEIHVTVSYSFVYTHVYMCILIPALGVVVFVCSVFVETCSYSCTLHGLWMHL